MMPSILDHILALANELAIQPRQSLWIRVLPDLAGVYCLWYGDTAFYIGKAMNIRLRLNDHYKTLKHNGRSVEDYFVCCMPCHPYIALALEAAAIDKLKPTDNGKGFGCKVQGIKRTSSNGWKDQSVFDGDAYFQFM